MSGVAARSGANKPTDEDLTELLLAARDGDQWKLATFIRHTQQDVQRLVTHLGARGEAEDLTQEVYLRAMRAIDSYRGESPARYWIIGIARRVAVDSIRSKGRRDKLRLAVMGRRPDHHTDNLSDSDLVALLSTMESGRRSAFVLTQVLELSYEEAAEMSDCAVGTIRSRVARARAELVEVWD